jgi:hypothetical protein
MAIGGHADAPLRRGGYRKRLFSLVHYPNVERTVPNFGPNQSPRTALDMLLRMLAALTSAFFVLLA